MNKLTKVTKVENAFSQLCFELSLLRELEPSISPRSDFNLILKELPSQFTSKQILDIKYPQSNSNSKSPIPTNITTAVNLYSTDLLQLTSIHIEHPISSPNFHDFVSLKSDFLPLVEKSLNLTYHLFQVKFYQQSSSSHMGSPPFIVFADILMEAFEAVALNSSQ